MYSNSGGSKKQKKLTPIIDESISPALKVNDEVEFIGTDKSTKISGENGTSFRYTLAQLKDDILHCAKDELIPIFHDMIDKRTPLPEKIIYPNDLQKHQLLMAIDTNTIAGIQSFPTSVLITDKNSSPCWKEVEPDCLLGSFEGQIKSIGLRAGQYIKITKNSQNITISVDLMAHQARISSAHDHINTLYQSIDDIKKSGIQSNNIKANTVLTVSNDNQIVSSDVLPLQNGGTGNSLVLKSAGIIYCSEKRMEVLESITDCNILLSGKNAPHWSALIFPISIPKNAMLYAADANRVCVLNTIENGVITSSKDGVPAFMKVGDGLIVENGQLKIAIDKESLIVEDGVLKTAQSLHKDARPEFGTLCVTRSAQLGSTDRELHSIYTQTSKEAKASIAGYWLVNINGATKKIPYYD